MNEQDKIESDFHDRWAASVDVNKIAVNELFESGSCPENQQILAWMGNLKGKRILDIGCGLGESSVYFAKQGAIVTAVDISEGMLTVTQRLAALHGVKLSTVHISAENLAVIPNQAFDYIYAANLLHHVVISRFIDEVKTKLVPGGSAFFWDPLCYNPVINFYRQIATQVRTPDEHPLHRYDLQLIKNRFAKVQVDFYWYSALAIFLKYFFVDWILPNQSRYWKKVIDDAAQIGPKLQFLHKLDRILFAWIPGIRWLAWNIVIRAETEKETK